MYQYGARSVKFCSLQFCGINWGQVFFCTHLVKKGFLVRKLGFKSSIRSITSTGFHEQIQLQGFHIELKPTAIWGKN